MASGFRPIAARRHVAPTPLSATRLVEKHPATGVVGADPDAIGATGADLVDKRIGQACQGIVEGIADVAVADRYAIGRADELDALARGDRPVDFGEGIGIGRPAMADRVGDVSQRSAHGTHACQGLVVADTLGT